MTSPDGNLLGTFTAFFDHGLLMVEDLESNAAHEGWDAATEFIHHDRDSLYIAVQSVVDGAVSVGVYRDVAPADEIEGLIPAFSGEIESDSGRFRIYDSDEAAVLTVIGYAGRNRLEVFIDEQNTVSRVVVVVGAMNRV